jgi:transcriptional regulator with XRE-family HTH domain
MNEGLTLQQLRLKAKLSGPKLAALAGLNYRTVAKAEIIGKPVYELTAEKIRAALERYFERYPEYVRGFVVPGRIEDIPGLVVYQTALHKGKRE